MFPEQEKWYTHFKCKYLAKPSPIEVLEFGTKKVNTNWKCHFLYAVCMMCHFLQAAVEGSPKTLDPVSPNVC